jgi:serine/threonine protein kinase
MKLCPKCHKQYSDDANFCPLDASRLAPLESPAADADALAAKFELGDPIGGSRTGTVVRAADRTTGQAAAVKLIAPAVVALPGVGQRLERELKQLERVQTAGVAKLLASGKRGDQPWVALELVAGAETLSHAIAQRGPFGPAHAAQLIETIGEALIEAAQVGVVHRDLAPKNILLAGADVKLINFSLPVPGTGRAAGVAEYAAPEQHDGKPVDQRSNLYSLGALYYFVLTGQPVQHDASGAIVPPSALVPAAAPIDAAILRALDKSPTKRFLTVRQFLDEVGRVARGEVDPAQLASRPSRPRAEMMQTLIGMRDTIPDAMPAMQPEPERSPWAPPSGPAGSVAAPALHAPAMTSAPAVAVAIAGGPMAAAPMVAAPMVPAPMLAGSLLGASKLTKPDDGKANFRDTLWFKKGELDAEVAHTAAEELARAGKDGALEPADSLPLDERYRDDGSLSRSDKEKYSLRTGATAMTRAVSDPVGAPGTAKVSEDALIGELKGGRNRIIAAIAIGIAVLALIALLIAR